MEHREMNSLTNQIQFLMESQADFPQKLKQRLVLESNGVKHPFQFVVELMNEGVLSDDSTDPEPYFGLNDMVVQLALLVACSKGADAVGGWIKALKASGNAQLISALRTWIMKDFAMKLESESERSCELKTVGSALPTSSVKLAQQGTIIKKNLLNPIMKSGSIAIKLMDKIIAHKEKELMEQLEIQLVGKSSKIVNVPEFMSALHENGVMVTSGPELEQHKWTKLAMKEACAQGAVGSLVIALQQSGNERILAETYDWLETSQLKTVNHPMAVRSLMNLRNQKTEKVVAGHFFEQNPPSRDLGKVATFTCKQGTLSSKPCALDFNKEKMIARLRDGTGHLWNWEDNEEKIIQFGADFKNMTWFEYDDEILVLGTSVGTVHLFDARREEKWSIRFHECVHSFKFLGSTLVIRTGVSHPNHVTFWRVEISRSDMRLLNQKRLASGDSLPGFFMDSDYIFVGVTDDILNDVIVFSTKSGAQIKEDHWVSSKDVPRQMQALNVVDLISTKRVVVVGCRSGIILVWNTPKFGPDPTPYKTLYGHTEKIVSLCAVTGHLLSLDDSGKLLMWSGHDLENGHLAFQTARVLAENFCNVTSLFAHERWFASCTPKDGIINIWTLPDLWIRTG